MAYGKRRRYLVGGQLDSVMNYPLRNAIIGFCSYRDEIGLYNTLTEIYASYPPHTCDCLMNIIGTHDTERIITRLASDMGICENIDELTNREKSEFKLDEQAYTEAKKILKIASVIQYTVYGVPSVYYGDEAGLEGCSDPFCRMPYPWGREDKELLAHYKALGKLRREEKVLRDGDFRAFTISEGVMGYERTKDGEKLLVLVSRGRFPITFKLDGQYRSLLDEASYKNDVEILPDTALVLKRI